MGKVWLSLTGKDGRKTVMMLNYVVFLKKFPLKIVSGEKLHRRGGCLERNKIISPRGEILTYINAEGRGFFIWLYNNPKPLEMVTPKRSLSHTSIIDLLGFQTTEGAAPSQEDEFRAAYLACWSNEIFKMSEDVMRRLVLWHGRPFHPSIKRLK